MKLLNKTFYRFVLGFIAIIALSLLIITAASYYENRSSESEEVTAENFSGED